MSMCSWTAKLATACAAVLMLAGCATAGETQPERSGPAAEGLTIERILKWPFDGQRGIEAVDTALASLFKLKPLHAEQFSGDGPVELRDGYVVRHVLIQRLTDAINIGLETEPCLSPAFAADLISAKPDPVTRTEHGEDIGQTFRVNRGGVTIEVGTRPVEHDCVTSIRLYGSARG